MNNAATAKKLASLAQLDYDAEFAYEEAMEKVEAQDTDIRRNLALFRDDHQRHFNDLSKTVVALGGKAPSMSPDIKGRFIEGMTSLKSSSGTAGVLKAMRMNETLTNKSYAHAASDDDFAGYPESLQQLLLRNYEDEKRHISYIEAALDKLAVAQG